MRKARTSTRRVALISVAVIAVHMLVLGAVFDVGKGGSPFTAVVLREGQNMGTLGPRQTRWYKLAREADDGTLQRQMDLTLVFTPGHGHRIQQVNFQIFAADQVARWYWRDAGHMQSLGAGGIVSRDGNPATGELLWSGWVADRDTYYVQVFNGADVSIEYWLFTGNVIAAGLGESVVGVPVDAVSSRSLASGVQSGRLPAGAETWFAVVYQDHDPEVYEMHTLAVVFAPGGGHPAGEVGFEVVPADDIYAWQSGRPELSHSLGTGSLASRDGDPNTGELLWSGWLADGQTYYIRLHNDAQVPIEYWFFMAGVVPSELGDWISP